MARKVIAFTSVEGTAASGTDTMLLGVLNGTGVFPQSAAAITAGLTASQFTQLVPTGGSIPVTTQASFAGPATTRLRINRPAGTFTLCVQGYSFGGQYSSFGWRVFDADGTTLRAQRTVTNSENTVGDRVVWTDGSYATTSVGDPGFSVTTTGAFFFVELIADQYFGRYSNVQFDEPSSVPLVANAYRIVPGSLPALPVPGTPYTFQVEAIDTTQGNARVTSYSTASVVFAVDVPMPDGLVVVSGDTDEPMTAGLAAFTLTFNEGTTGPVTLAAPTLTAGAPTDTSSQRSVSFTAVTSGAAWPGGTTVQLQSRRGSASFADAGAAFAASGSRTLVFARESSAYTVEVRGIASAAGATSSAASSVLTITVPALVTEPGTLAAPTLTFGAPTDAPTTRTVVLTVTPASGAPGGTVTQLQSRQDAAAFATDGAPMTGTRTFVLPRGSLPYTFAVRGIAQAAGFTDSAPSAAVTVTVPMLEVPAITVATPLRCSVQLFPSTAEPVSSTGGGGIPTLIARTATDHVLRITTIRAEITNASVVPTSIRYTIASAGGTLTTATVTSQVSADLWQIALSRALFTASRGPLTLTLTLVAPDTTETQLTYTLSQGVNQ